MIQYMKKYNLNIEIIKRWTKNISKQSGSSQSVRRSAGAAMDRNHAPPVTPDDPLSPASDCSMRSQTKSPTMEPTSKAKPPERPFLPEPPKETRQEWERRERKEQKMWEEAEDGPGLQKPITQSEMQDIKRWNKEGKPPLTQSEIEEMIR